MKQFMIIAKVKDTEYLTKVNAESEISAEHMILDLSVCGRHTYGVTACMAYDAKAMKYDTFIYSAINATPVDFETLTLIISDRNAEILEKDAAEHRIQEIENSIKELTKELEEAKRIFNK
jgi:hypothetical protein